MIPHPHRRRRTPLIAALGVLALVGAACSSDGDASPDSSETHLTADSSPTTVVAESTVTPVDTAGAGTAGSAAGDSSESAIDVVTCGGITGTEMTAAVGAGDFDSVDDLSMTTETTCVFSNSTSTYAVSVARHPTSSYMAGDLDGLAESEALDRLATLLTAPMDEGATVTRATDGDHEMIVVTGIDSIVGAAAGAGAVVADGTVIVVDMGGTELATEPAGFDPLVRNVLALATANAL